MSRYRLYDQAGKKATAVSAPRPGGPLDGKLLKWDNTAQAFADGGAPATSNPVAPSLIVPASSVLSTPSNAVWFAANTAVFHRFNVPSDRSYRYVNLAVAASSGNWQVGVVRISGTGFLNYTRVMDSGVVATPAAGDQHVDLGATTLTAGDYAVYVWFDNIVTQVRLVNATAIVAGRMIAELPSLTTGVPASGTFVAWNGSHAVQALTVEAP